jgi:hypothetical protein
LRGGCLGRRFCAVYTSPCSGEDPCTTAVSLSNLIQIALTACAVIKQRYNHLAGMHLTIRLLADASAAFVGSKVVQYLSEELGDGAVTSKRERNASSSDSIADRRRILLAAMTQSSAGLLSLQIQSASHYLQLGVAQAAGDHDKAAASNVAVGAALQAIVALVAWLPMKVMHESSLADACSALMHVKDLQGLVLEILLQVCAACLHASTQRRWRCLATRLHRCVLYFHLTCLDVRMLWRVLWSQNMTHYFRHTIPLNQGT